MTVHQERLLARALDYWTQGRRIPLDLFSLLVQEGMDVEALEAKHMNEKD